MSRSAFAARFTHLVGEPAMQYLTHVRMEFAVKALRDDGATVAELASRLGYRSQAAFARAFKREVGVAPGRDQAVRSGPDRSRAGRPGANRSSLFAVLDPQLKYRDGRPPVTHRSAPTAFRVWARP
jgi:AraC-like DNA-binding protein